MPSPNSLQTTQYVSRDAYIQARLHFFLRGGRHWCGQPAVDGLGGKTLYNCQDQQVFPTGDRRRGSISGRERTAITPSTVQPSTQGCAGGGWQCGAPNGASSCGKDTSGLPIESQNVEIANGSVALYLCGVCLYVMILLHAFIHACMHLFMHACTFFFLHFFFHFVCLFVCD